MDHPISEIMTQLDSIQRSDPIYENHCSEWQVQNELNEQLKRKDLIWTQKADFVKG